MFYGNGNKYYQNQKIFVIYHKKYPDSNKAWWQPSRPHEARVIAVQFHV